MFMNNGGKKKVGEKTVTGKSHQDGQRQVSIDQRQVSNMGFSQPAEPGPNFANTAMHRTITDEFEKKREREKTGKGK